MNSCATKSKETCNAVTITASTTIITQSYNMKGFSGIDIGMVGNVEYVQGDRYSVSITAPGDIISNTEVCNKSGLLSIQWKKGTKHKDKDECKKTPIIRITSPRMDIINMYGVNVFKAKNIKGGDMKIDLSGVNSLYIDNLSSKSLTMNMSGVVDGKININAKKVKFDGTGVIDIKSSVCSDDFKIVHSGSGEYKVTFSGKQGRIDNTGNGEININATKTDLLDIVNSGLGEFKIDFKGREVKINNTGNGEVKANLGCQRIMVKNAGYGEVTLVGTADDVQIDNEGFSNVDSSKLNKY
ncbi:hypothetical protein JCM15124A_16080 [Prevotella falsenii]